MEREVGVSMDHEVDAGLDKENLSRGHGEDRESWTRGMTC